MGARQGPTRWRGKPRPRRCCVPPVKGGGMLLRPAREWLDVGHNEYAALGAPSNQPATTTPTHLGSTRAQPPHALHHARQPRRRRAATPPLPRKCGPMGRLAPAAVTRTASPSTVPRRAPPEVQHVVCCSGITVQAMSAPPPSPCAARCRRPCRRRARTMRHIPINRRACAAHRQDRHRTAGGTVMRAARARAAMPAPSRLHCAAPRRPEPIGWQPASRRAAAGRAPQTSH